MPKLVRDKIPDIIRAKGGDPQVRIAPEEERHRLLVDKLLEEVEELRQAETRADAYEEMADVLEVVAALVATFDERRLERLRGLKREIRGGFEKFYVLSP